MLATESKVFLNFLSKIYCINDGIRVESKSLKLWISLYIKCQGPHLTSKYRDNRFYSPKPFIFYTLLRKPKSIFLSWTLHFSPPNSSFCFIDYSCSILHFGSIKWTSGIFLGLYCWNKILLKDFFVAQRIIYCFLSSWWNAYHCQR